MASAMGVAGALIALPGVMTSTGTPSASTRLGRSRRSHFDTRLGKVQMITRS